MFKRCIITIAIGFGLVIFQSDLTLGISSKVVLNVTSNSTYDFVKVNGDLTVGGELALNFADSYTAVEGDTITLFDMSGGSGTISGTFSTITGLDSAPNYYEWDTSNLYTEGKITLQKDMDYWVDSGPDTTPGSQIVLADSASYQRGRSTILTNGNIAHAYQKWVGSKSMLYFQIRDRDGNVVLGNTAIHSNDWGDYRSLDITYLNSGKFAVIYSNRNPDTFVTIYNNDGSIHVSHVRVSTIGGGRLHIAENNSGQIIATIEGNSTANPHKVSILNQDGTLELYNKSIPGTPSNYAYSMTLPLDDGNYYVIGADYGSKDKVMVQKMSSTFTQIGSTRYVFDRLSSGIYQHPSAIILDNGNVAIGTSAGYYKYAVAVMDQNLNVLHSNSDVSSMGSVLERKSYLAPLSNGEFMVAFEEGTKRGYVGKTKYMIFDSSLGIVLSEQGANPSGADSRICGLDVGPDGSIIIGYNVSGSPYKNYGRLFTDSLILDRDSDGVADIYDIFPDDPLLQSMPTYQDDIPSRVGLKLWLDGSQPHGDTNSFTAGDPIMTWVDLSGNGYHATQVTASYQPTIGTFPSTSKTAINFDGSNDRLPLNMSFADQSVDALNVFVVYKTASEGNYSLLSFDKTTYFDLATSTSGGHKLSFQTAGTGITEAEGTLVNSITGAGDGHVYSAIFNKTVVTSHPRKVIREDGKTLGTSTLPEAGLGIAGETRYGYIGAPSEASSYAGNIGSGSLVDGMIAEIVVYNRYMNKSEIQEIEEYLARKWNIDKDANVDDDAFPFEPTLGDVPTRSQTVSVTTGLVLHYDAEYALGDDTSLTDGDSVPAWVNLASGEYHATQPNPAKQPTYKENVFGSRPGLLFTGSEFMELPIRSQSDTNTAAFTLVLELMGTSADTVWRAAYSSRYVQTDNTTSGMTAYKSDANYWSTWIGSTGVSWASSTSSRPVKVNNSLVLTMVFDGTSLKVRENGLELGTSTASLEINTEVSPRIGAGATERFVPYYFFNGYVGKVLLYSRALSPDELSEVEDDIKQNLPSTDQVWVDPSYIGSSYGSESEPYTSFDDALEVVKSGGDIIIKNSNIPLSKTIDKKVNIKTSGGASKLGSD